MIVLTLKHREDFKSLMSNHDYKIIDYSDDLIKVQIVPLFTYSLDYVKKDLAIYGTVERIATPMCVSGWSFPKH